MIRWIKARKLKTRRNSPKCWYLGGKFESLAKCQGNSSSKKQIRSRKMKEKCWWVERKVEIKCQVCSRMVKIPCPNVNSALGIRKILWLNIKSTQAYGMPKCWKGSKLYKIWHCVEKVRKYKFPRHLPGEFQKQFSRLKTKLKMIP